MVQTFKCRSLVAIVAIITAQLSSSFIVTEDQQTLDGDNAGKEKSFSLFNVIRFPNLNCEAVSNATMIGTCLTTEECTSAGGEVDGNCASGFGVCCILFQSTCGSVDVTRNCTYLVNPEYPEPSNLLSSTCTYNLKTDFLKTSENDDICQVRLDFADLLIVQPVLTTGACQGDTFSLVGPTTRNPPVLCGNANNMHMYVETARQDNAAVATIVTGTADFLRQWKIKVSFIKCNTNYRAPIDCVQYFTGLAGVVQSYNWLAQTTQIRGMNYMNCFRQEEGFCSIEYTVSSAADTPVDYFNLGGGNAMRSVGACIDQRVELTLDFSFDQPGGTTGTTDEFCGGQLAADNDNVQPGVLRSSVTPFTLAYFTSTTGTFNNFQGFQIDWRLVACGSAT